ncbi:hypothetical protein [Roseovarius sp. MMSF_3281]|uniref:hypothetical protein n=1 Tax=Roseovarius sp. MMSF_3281 TaxID=3046694 RepID=UPI00273F542B|nr:hypothetical protein [Roseovarius sp. MMSF_3281]
MDIQNLQSRASSAATAIDFIIDDVELAAESGDPQDINEAYIDQAIRALQAIKEEIRGRAAESRATKGGA